MNQYDVLFLNQHNETKLYTINADTKENAYGIAFSLLNNEDQQHYKLLAIELLGIFIIKATPLIKVRELIKF